MTRNRIQALDGVRALGMFLIIAGHLHALGFASGQEIYGNFIFFYMSGFMAALYAVENKYRSYKYVASFYFKSFMKVMPLLFVACVFYYYLDRNNDPIENLTFTNSHGTVCFLAHLMLFWLILPGLMLLIDCLKGKLRVNDITVAVMLIMMELIYRALIMYKIPLITQGAVNWWRFDLLLSGMALGYLCRSNVISQVANKKTIQISLRLLAVGAAGCIVLINDYFQFIGIQQTIRAYLPNILLLFIFCIYFTQSSLLSKLLGLRPIEFIGRQSFGLMLFHLPLHSILPYTGVMHFVLVFFATLLLAWLCECLIVKPINKVAAGIARDMEAQKGFDVVSIQVYMLLLIYLAGVYMIAHNKEYTIGDTVGFSAYSANGIRYEVSGLGTLNANGSPIKNTAKLKFIIDESSEFDLLATLRLSDVKSDAKVRYSVDGVDLGTTDIEKGSMARLSIPNEYIEDSNIVIEFSIEDTEKGVVPLLSSAELQEERSYQLGNELTFTADKPTANAYFDYGLGVPETTATWAKDSAQLRIPLAEKPSGDLNLNLSWQALDTHAQTMIVSCAGHELFNQKLESEYSVNITVPQDLVTNQELQLELEFPDACPSSFAFSSMKIDEKSKYTLGRQLSFASEKATANEHFAFGLGIAEDKATWAKQKARLDMALDHEVNRDLVVRLTWDAVDTHTQRMIVTAAGNEILSDSFLAENEVEFVVPHNMIDQDRLTLDFDFPDACPSSFAFTTLAIEQAK